MALQCMYTCGLSPADTSNNGSMLTGTGDAHLGVGGSLRLTRASLKGVNCGSCYWILHLQTCTISHGSQMVLAVDRGRRLPPESLPWRSHGCKQASSLTSTSQVTNRRGFLSRFLRTQIGSETGGPGRSRAVLVLATKSLLRVAC